MNRQRWYILTVTVLVLGAGALLWGRVPPDAESGALPPAPAIGHPAPEFTLASLSEDGSLTLSDLRGQPVVMNFWASWCGPCRSEMPELQRLHEQLADAGVVVLGVNQGESSEVVARFRDEIGVDFPTVLDQRTGVSQQYLVNSLPTTFFIDRDGVIQTTFIGAMTDAVLAENLRTIYP